MNTLSQIVFSEIAGRLGARHDKEQDSISLGMLGQEYVVSHDGVLLRGQKSPDSHVVIVLDYLQSCGRNPILTPWRSIRDFPDAEIHDFREKVEMPIAHAASDIIARANVLLPMVEGKISRSLINSDLAFTVRALPNVHFHVELCRESQDFPSESWVLFSNNAVEFLSLRSLQALAELFKDRLLGLARIY